MTPLLADVGAVGIVPEGPLHPGLAVAGLVLGVALTVVAGPHPRAWAALVAGGVIVALRGVLGEWPIHAFLDRPDRVSVVVVTIGVALGGVVLRLRRSTATALAVGACGGVWMIAPDTEAALLGAAVLVAAGATARIPGWMPDLPSRFHSLVVLIPVVAAVVGTVGRPARLTLALVVGACAGLVVLAGWQVVCGPWLRQRAGTPTTVVPAGTSSTTTAPAPTTAS